MSLDTYKNNQRQFMLNAASEAEKRVGNIQTSNSTAQNEKEVDGIFDEFINKVNARRNQVKEEVRTMTPNQQKQVLDFWEEFRSFFSDLVSWIREAVQKVIKLIETITRAVSAVLSLIETIRAKIKEYF